MWRVTAGAVCVAAVSLAAATSEETLNRTLAELSSAESQLRDVQAQIRHITHGLPVNVSLIVGGSPGIEAGPTLIAHFVQQIPNQVALAVPVGVLGLASALDVSTFGKYAIIFSSAGISGSVAGFEALRAWGGHRFQVFPFAGPLMVGSVAAGVVGVMEYLHFKHVTPILGAMLGMFVAHIILNLGLSYSTEPVVFAIASMAGAVSLYLIEKLMLVIVGAWLGGLLLGGSVDFLVRFFSGVTTTWLTSLAWTIGEYETGEIAPAQLAGWAAWGVFFLGSALLYYVKGPLYKIFTGEDDDEDLFTVESRFKKPLLVAPESAPGPPGYRQGPPGPPGPAYRQGPPGYRQGPPPAHAYRQGGPPPPPPRYGR